MDTDTKGASSRRSSRSRSEATQKVETPSSVEPEPANNASFQPPKSDGRGRPATKSSGTKSPGLTYAEKQRIRSRKVSGMRCPHCDKSFISQGGWEYHVAQAVCVEKAKNGGKGRQGSSKKKRASSSIDGDEGDHSVYSPAR